MKASDGLRVLFVSAGIPFPQDNGSKLRTASVLRGFFELGHRVSLFTLGTGTPAGLAETESFCESVRTFPHALSNQSKSSNYWDRLVNLPRPLPYGTSRYASSEFRATIDTAVKSGKFDVLLCDTLDCMINVPEDCSIPVVLNNQNVEHQILMRFLQYEPNPLRRSYAKLEAGKLRRFERISCSRADLTMVCSEVDADIIRHEAPGCVVTVVPNVVDVESYEIQPEPREPVLIYTGGMDWFPNRDAVEFFAFQVLPLIRHAVPGVKVIVAGRNPSKEFTSQFNSIDNLEFTGSVPDMRPQIARAQISIVPLRIGSGTRLKILEAAASGRPVVSTALGAEGLNFRDKEEILIADSPQDFATATINLLQNDQLRHAMASRANAVVRREYTSEVVKREIQKSLDIVVTRRQSELVKGPR